MSVSPIELWSQVPAITLATDNHPRGTAVEDIDLSAAFLLKPDQARDAGILPFRREDGCLWVAAAEPLSPAAWALLDRLGPVRIYRTVLANLLVAQWKVYGSPGDNRPLFGDIAVNKYGLSPHLLNRALEIQNRQGGTLGQICLSIKALNSWQVANVLGEQTSIPVTNLLDNPSHDDHTLNAIWSLMTKDEWRQYAMVPVSDTLKEIVVAVANPFDNRGPMSLGAKPPNA